MCRGQVGSLTEKQLTMVELVLRGPTNPLRRPIFARSGDVLFEC